MIPGWMTPAGDDASIAATAVFVLFVIQYTLTSPWWRDPLGATVVMQDLMLLGLLVPTSVLIFYPTALTPLQIAWIELIVLAGIVLTMAWRCVVWWRIRRPWPFRDTRRARPPLPSEVPTPPQPVKPPPARPLRADAGDLNPEDD